MPEFRSERKSIWIYIKLDGEGFATSPEFNLRYAIEDAIIERNIGNYEGAGSGGGWMDISFGVENINAVPSALLAIKNLLTEYGVPDSYVRLEVNPRFEQTCEDDPDYKAGDCLSFHFTDGDYGAALVLEQSIEEQKTLLGLIDYKHHLEPAPEIFERRQWLIGSGQPNEGQPYLVWVHCFGGIEIKMVHHTPIAIDDPKKCSFNLSWELVPEFYIRDKYQDDKVRNPYHRERIDENLPKFELGDCITFQFEDGDFGAAIVLDNFDKAHNRKSTLLSILDYKKPESPSLAVFQQKKLQIVSQEWRKGQNFLVWAKHCYGNTCEHLETQTIGQLELDVTTAPDCMLELFWEDIPEYLALEQFS